MKSFDEWKTARRESAYRRIEILAILITLVIGAFTQCSVSEQNKLLRNELKLNEDLNRPLCSIENFAVESIDKGIVLFSVVLNNHGKQVASNAIFTGTTYYVEDLNLPDLVKSEQIKSSKFNWSQTLTLIPDQKIVLPLLYIEKKDLNRFIEGYKKALDVEFSLIFKDKQVETNYTVKYRIMRILNDEKYGIYLVHNGLKN